LEKLTVTWQELKALSQKHFKWHSTHFSRKWEYPWVASRLADMKLDGLKLLDAGAGMSPIALWAADNGAHVVTVDSGGQKGKGAGFVNYTCYNALIASHKADFAKMPFLADNSLDVVVSVSVIEHVISRKRQESWAEWNRILKPNGRLILTLDLVGPSDRLLNKRDGQRLETNEAHGYLSDLRWELQRFGYAEVNMALCPYKRRWSKRERTTHVLGMVLRKNENQP